MNKLPMHMNVDKLLSHEQTTAAFFSRRGAGSNKILHPSPHDWPELLGVGRSFTNEPPNAVCDHWGRGGGSCHDLSSLFSPEIRTCMY